MENFDSLGLPQPLLHALTAMKFSNPTPIQVKAIPVALAGRDILGSAETGTGKTAAYAIPLLARLMAKPQGKALVLAPTRELAAQVTQAIHQMLGRGAVITTALLIGGETMQKQFQQLRRNPRIIVGTPGRINDHLERGTLKLNDADFLVLDETDRMLDMGFGVQIDRILKHMPQKRQTLMFSATLPPHIVKLSERYLHQPERIAIGSTTTPVSRIKQEEIRTTAGEKYNVLIGQLGQREGSVIVFVKTKHGADRLADRLSRADFAAEAIHGDLRQNRRDRVIRDFREKKHRILVATDVAARGLDIPHIEHVVNYDLPQCPEDYIHRLGRTARAGAEGAAVCLLTPEDGDKWRAIQRLINPGKEGTGKSGPGAPRQAPPKNRNNGHRGKRRFGNQRRTAAAA